MATPLRTHLGGLGLDPGIVKDIEACFHPRPIRRRSVFLRAGEVDARLGFVVSGLFTMEVVHADGRLFVKDFLGEGSFLLGAFQPDQESLVTFRALRDAQVMEARYTDIMALQAKHPTFGALARRSMEKRYEALCTRLERLAGEDAAARYRAFRTEFQTLEKDIPLHLVAAYLNITPTQLSRLRKRRSL